MRKNSQGIDPSLHIPRYMHHGVTIPDSFMEAVIKNEKYELVTNSGVVTQIINARDLWMHLLSTRVETGEPYILFTDNANKELSPAHRKMNLEITTSNLCTEIVLPTGKDNEGDNRTAVCCLSSINLNEYHIWKNDEMFIKDLLMFQDNVLTYFIVESSKHNVGDNVHYNQYDGFWSDMRKQEREAVHRAKETNHPLKNAILSAFKSRDIGIGMTGLSTLLQTLRIPFDSEAASNLNSEIFNLLKIKFDIASAELAHERGANPDCAQFGIMERFSYKSAIAPTAQLSSFLGVSPTMQVQMPIYLSKTQAGSHLIKNPLLETELDALGLNSNEVWMKIANEGTSFLSKEIHEIFKGPYEIDQQVNIDLAANRKIDQAQSINLFFDTPVDKNHLNKVHIKAWRSGVKTLYYLYSAPKLSSFSGLQDGFALFNEEKKSNVEIIQNSIELNNKEKNSTEEVCLYCQ
jgi:ribonucleoside-diphosphate reductase alpha chain